MKAGVRNSHHHSTAGAGTLGKGNNKTENSILKIAHAVVKLEKENLETFASSPPATEEGACRCCAGDAEEVFERVSWVPRSAPDGSGGRGHQPCRKQAIPAAPPASAPRGVGQPQGNNPSRQRTPRGARGVNQTLLVPNGAAHSEQRQHIGGTADPTHRQRACLDCHYLYYYCAFLVLLLFKTPNQDQTVHAMPRHLVWVTVLLRAACCCRPCLHPYPWLLLFKLSPLRDPGSW